MLPCLIEFIKRLVNRSPAFQESFFVICLSRYLTKHTKQSASGGTKCIKAWTAPNISGGTSRWFPQEAPNRPNRPDRPDHQIDQIDEIKALPPGSDKSGNRRDIIVFKKSN